MGKEKTKTYWAKPYDISLQDSCFNILEIKTAFIVFSVFPLPSVFNPNWFWSQNYEEALMLGFVSERWWHLCSMDAVSYSRFLAGFGGSPDIAGGGRTWGSLTSCDYCLSWQPHSVYLLSNQLMFLLWIALWRGLFLSACHPCDPSIKSHKCTWQQKGSWKRFWVSACRSWRHLLG